MAIVLQLLDADGTPLHLPDDARVVLLDAGTPIATGVHHETGSIHFDTDRGGDALAVRLEFDENRVESQGGL